MATKIPVALKPLPDLDFPRNYQVKIFVEVITLNIEMLGFEIKSNRIPFSFNNPHQLSMEIEVISKSKLNYIIKIVVSKDNNYYARLHAFCKKQSNINESFYMSSRMKLTNFEKNFESIIMDHLK